jgi:5-formyltetrahydrofolate cyclo-ligase
MGESYKDQKAALREKAQAALLGHTAERREADGKSICERLVTRPLWTRARSILLFAPRSDEPNVWPLAELALGAGKVVCLPRFIRAAGIYEAAVIADATRDIVAGHYGIREPAPLCIVADLNQLDLVLVPGLAFDWHGHRLGRGKGYYDRLLASVSGTACGVAFDSQLISAIPVEPHDVRLHCILTPSHWLEFRPVRGW